jgi:hypothetical protein
MKEHGRCCDRFTNGALIWSIPTMTSAVIIMSFMVQTVSSIGVSRSLRWHQIDEIEPHALEWAVDRLTQMLAIELIASVSGVTIAVQASEKFGRDDVIDARPLQGLECLACLAHDDVTFPTSVRFGYRNKRAEAKPTHQQ